MKNKKEPADTDRSVLLYVAVYEEDSDAVIRRLQNVIVKTAINRWITRKRHPNGNPNVHCVHELTGGCI